VGVGRAGDVKSEREAFVLHERTNLGDQAVQLAAEALSFIVIDKIFLL